MSVTPGNFTAGMDRARLAHPSAVQHGVVTRRDARTAGLTDRQVDVCVAEGLLLPLHEGVYRHAAHPYTERTRLMAAALASGGVVSHRSAARLHGLRDVPRWRPEVCVRQRHLPRLAGVLVHRTNQLEPVDLTVVDGVPTVAAASALFQLGAVLPVCMVIEAAQDAVLRRLVTDVDLVCVLERLGRRGRGGSAAMREVVATLAPAGLESRLEARLHALLKRTIAQPPVLQHPLTLPDGSSIRLDFAWPRARVTVEADGRIWHSTKSDFERDLVRSRGLASAGWTHYRYGWTDVHERQAAVLAELRAVGAAVAGAAA